MAGTPQGNSRSRIIAAAGLLSLALIIAFVVAASGSGSGGGSARAGSSRVLESVLQDDQYLLARSPSTVSRTLDTLRSLGVDRVRVTARWFDLAPANFSGTKPGGFQPANPASYSPAVWVPFDQLVTLAHARGIGVDLDVTAPGPLWAMQTGAPDPKASTHWFPSPAEFGAFVTAVGRRYSGSYVPPGSGRSPLPRVSFWTIWNEPNQPGWLLPQWRTRGGSPQAVSPSAYRALLDAAWSALGAAGHSPRADTILGGELAPEGTEAHRTKSAIPPMSFLRDLYCVDGAYHPLRGASAATAGCPSGASFVAAHPALFKATGFAHHPYSFFLPPTTQISDQNFVPLANLNRLENGLDAIFSSYGVDRRLPLYLTEYGYETNPPNPYRGVTLQVQAQYLDQAQYLAWRDPRVRAMTQFLLYDSAPDVRYRRGSVRYWSTFQTGLLFIDGRRKPSYDPYRLPIYLPAEVARRGSPFTVWGMLRAAPNNTRQQAQVQWRTAGGQYRTLQTVSTNDPSGVLTAQLSVPGTGLLRIAWRSPGGAVFYSREATVRVQ
jgi:hypothetical protein